MKRNHFHFDFKFFSFCFLGGVMGYVLVLDRYVSFDVIWNNNLWFLLAAFVFGVVYSLEFFSISLWLLAAMVSADFVLGINLSLIGPSCWSGFCRFPGFDFPPAGLFTRERVEA